MSAASRLDGVAHFLYCPTMLGRRCARAQWHHHIHLIPAGLLSRVCDHYDRALGVTEDEMYRTAASHLWAED